MVAIAAKQKPKTEIRIAFSVENQIPWHSLLLSQYGIAASRISATVGTITPAHAGSMCSSNSCRFRKYQGALEGVGVVSASARLSKGASNIALNTSSAIVNRTAAMNSMKTRSGQTRTSSSRSRRGRLRTAAAA